MRQHLGLTRLGRKLLQNLVQLFVVEVFAGHHDTLAGGFLLGSLLVQVNFVAPLERGNLLRAEIFVEVVRLQAGKHNGHFLQASDVTAFVRLATDLILQPEGQNFLEWNPALQLGQPDLEEGGCGAHCGRIDLEVTKYLSDNFCELLSETVCVSRVLTL